LRMELRNIWKGVPSNRFSGNITSRKFSQP
jgi:hypothetical protein